MATYTSIGKVEAVLGPDIPIDELSEPTRAQVLLWIPDVSGVAASSLVSGGSSLPITDAELLARLDLLCAREVGYQVMATRGAAGKDDQETVYDRWHKEFMETMEIFATPGEVTAPGSTGGSPSSYTMDAPSDTDLTINALFTKRQVW